MINELQLRDFKGHRSTDVPLGRFTMLVGDNASGKTSVLDALWLHASMSTGPISILKGDWLPDDLLRRGATGPIVIGAAGATRDRRWSTTTKLELLPAMGKHPERPWAVNLDGSLGEKQIAGNATGHSGGGSTGGDWNAIAETVGNVGLYRLRADRIAAAAYSNQPDALVETDGTNTAVALAAMKLGNDEAFERIEQAMRKLIPSVERIRIQRATVQHPGVGGVVGSRLYFDFRGAPGVPAHNASHGTLIVLALLTVIHGSQRPNLILLDDFDHALHPRAQMELVRMIKGLLALDEFQGLQVVATTHSPYTLDELDPSEVQAFALRDDGTVASRRLSEHPEAARMKGALRAGQLWSLDPERDWVLREQAA